MCNNPVMPNKKNKKEKVPRFSVCPQITLEVGFFPSASIWVSRSSMIGGGEDQQGEHRLF
uniref:Uncharacterized protein n=1 Tax=Rhizophora mucronata TaxID=61149 RepID=A0A2P2PSA8_RHIMU